MKIWKSLPSSYTLLYPCNLRYNDYHDDSSFRRGSQIASVREIVYALAARLKLSKKKFICLQKRWFAFARLAEFVWWIVQKSEISRSSALFRSEQCLIILVTLPSRHISVFRIVSLFALPPRFYSFENLDIQWFFYLQLISDLLSK